MLWGYTNKEGSEYKYSEGQYMTKATKACVRNPRNSAIITAQGDKDFIEWFKLACEGRKSPECILSSL